MTTVYPRGISGLISRILTPRYRYLDSNDQILARLVMAANVNGLSAAAIIAVALPLLTLNIPQVAGSSVIFAVLCFLNALVSLFLVNTGRLRLSAAAWFIGFSGFTLLVFESGIGTSYVLVPVTFLVFAVFTFSWRGFLAASLCIFVVAGIQIYRQVTGVLIPLPLNGIAQIPAVFSANVAVTIIIGFYLVLFVETSRTAVAKASRLFVQVRALSDVIGSLNVVQDVDVLSEKAVTYIRDRFGLYAVQLYLTNRENREVVLRATTDDNARIQQGNGYRLALNADDPVPQTARERKSTVTERNPDLTPSEVLNEARTQLTIALVAEQEVLGVLDIRSTRPAAFSTEEIESYELVAVQLANAIHNAQLYEQQRVTLNDTRRRTLDAEVRLRELQQINQRLVAATYQDFIQSRQNRVVGYTLNEDRVRPDSDWSSQLQQALSENNIVVRLEGDKNIYALPVSLRDTVIGGIEIEMSADAPEPEIRELLSAVASRLAVSVDNARLFEQTQRAAERERKVNIITTALEQETNIERILETAVVELGRALRVPAAVIRLRKDAIPDRTGGTGPLVNAPTA